jgi:uncharacterized protein YybS (DUF2232 family)
MQVEASNRRTPDARGIAEGALIADLTVLVVLMGLYVPYASAVLAAFASIPLLLLIIRRGWRVSVEATVVACLLVGFLTGPLSAVAVLAVAARAAALGIGLRRFWPVPKTVLVGTTFLWGVLWSGVTMVALAFPAWRAGTEQGITLTYHELTALAGLAMKLVGFGRQWAHLLPQLNDGFAWLLGHWLMLLPAVIWPVLLIMVGAEYVIAEAVLPRFGIEPPPFYLPLVGAASDRMGSAFALTLTATPWRRFSPSFSKRTGRSGSRNITNAAREQEF